MKDVIRITTDFGHMAIILDKFFPADHRSTKQVFRLMLDDPSWTDERIDELIGYFHDMGEAHRTEASFALREGKTYERSAELIRQTKPRRNSSAYAKYREDREKAKEMFREEKNLLWMSDQYFKTGVLLMKMYRRVCE